MFSVVLCCVVLFTKPGYGRLLGVKNRHVYNCAEVSNVVMVVVEVECIVVQK